MGKIDADWLIFSTYLPKNFNESTNILKPVELIANHFFVILLRNFNVGDHWNISHTSFVGWIFWNIWDIQWSTDPCYINFKILRTPILEIEFDSSIQYLFQFKVFE